jgi:hypothetical protein
MAPGRAIWAYRNVDGRAASAVAKFGAHNRDMLAAIAAGRTPGIWQAQGLSDQSLDLLRSFDYASMTPLSGAALFWLVRNRLFFETGLDQRSDVMLMSYDGLLRDPDGAVSAMCRFLGLPFRSTLVRQIDVRGAAQRKTTIDPRIRALCEELEAKLDTFYAEQLAFRP